MKRGIVFPLTSASLALAIEQRQCYTRYNNTVRAEGAPWYVCNNTQINPGGASLCCYDESLCGPDSFCGSTNIGQGSYKLADARMGRTRTQFVEPLAVRFPYQLHQSRLEGFADGRAAGDGATWFQWNETTEVYHCCGHNACIGIVTDEAFSATPPDEWEPSARLATTTSSPAAAATATVTVQATSPVQGSRLSTGAQAGIGTACGVAGAGVVCALTFLLLRRRRLAGPGRKNRSPLRPLHHELPPDGSMKAELNSSSYDGNTRNKIPELETERSPAEVACVEHPRQELDGHPP
ncbi:hypothetical protein D0869_05202 [Hortaea werneckii]|uniref:Uncharacterized protein n=1 Tax=Hortaea werneckii TaxID=91943 RepID=A0A3M6YJ61_HORWE|nr:hypothetical protein KC334_g17334 [Hortaea werneckii]KAI7007868.1 hypothetical protein KC355_g7173 [Hortaea werneckii]KAI7202776.1 hypothetical protein KC324_g1574 [Hortaea werneckii]KAI7593489.1 hypothetical protein KC316_g1701 [Hortaea werneckii]KAI7665849.1 hypothetical protein KC318_g6855 [Hortaea werneckii]